MRESMTKKKRKESEKLNNLTITEFKDIRVLTTQQIAEVYETESKTISYNFNHNKERYKEGKHFILLNGNELRAFREIHDLPTSTPKLYLWTEKGAFLHAKSLNTDKAWEVYDHLVDNYFNKKKPLTVMEQIQILAQGNIELEQKIDSVDRDLQEFKKDMPLLALECQRITVAKNKKVVPLLGGKDAPAYKNSSLRSKVYGDVDSQLRREFGVSSYKAIRRNQTDKAIEIIENYELPLYLKESIANENAQMHI